MTSAARSPIATEKALPAKPKNPPSNPSARVRARS